MAHIKRISFSTVPTKLGCNCDRCGQWIKNIWTVEYKEGFTINYGIDCFEKVYKNSGLSQQGEKMLKKSLKYIKELYKQLDDYKNGKITAETDKGYQFAQTCDGGHYWKGKPYEEYKAFMIDECLPAWIEKQEQGLEKFKNINFKEEA